MKKNKPHINFQSLDALTKISERDIAERLYRYGDDFTNNIRKAHIVTNSNGMSITRSEDDRYKSSDFIYPNLPFNTAIHYIYCRYEAKRLGVHINTILPKRNKDSKVYKDKQIDDTLNRIINNHSPAEREGVVNRMFFEQPLTIGGMKPSHMGTGILDRINQYPLTPDEAYSPIAPYLTIIKREHNLCKLTSSFGGNTPFVSIRNNNIDLTINNPAEVELFKKLLTKIL